MASRPRSLSVENLESRLNLSTLAKLPVLGAPESRIQSQEVMHVGAKLVPLSSLLQKKTDVGAINAPASLKAAGSSARVTLSWSDRSNNESGFRVLRSADGVNFSQIGSVGKGKKTFNDSSAVPGTTYFYKIAAFKGTELSASSNTVAAKRTVVITLPTSPNGVVATPASSTSIALSWNDRATNESGYRVYRSTNNKTYALVAQLAANTSNYVDAAVKASTKYYYKISAWNTRGQATSAAVTATTPATPAPVPPPAPTPTPTPTPNPTPTLVVAPAAPTMVILSNITTSSMFLTWGDAATNESGYRVYRSTDGVNFSKIADLAANATSYNATSLTGGTTYTFKIAAWNSAGETAADAVSAATLTPAPVVVAPASPTNLSFSNITTTAITLNWTDAANNETGYRVFRSTSGANFTKIADLSANVSTYSDTALVEGTQYFYKVAAWNSADQSLTPVGTATTLAPPPAVVVAPAGPTNLSFSNITTTAIKLNWTDAANNESGYRVYRSTNGTNFTKIADLSANISTYSDSGLSVSTQYFYKVAAWNSAAESMTPAGSATTLTPPPIVVAPANPTSLSFSNITTTAIKLNWTDAANNESGYRVYRSTNGTNFTKIADLSANISTYSDSGLSVSTQYFYKVAAWNSAAESMTPAGTATTLTPPPAPTPTGNPVTFTTRSMTTFSELLIDGTSGNDSITVTQSGGILTIVANGVTTTYSNTFGDIMIRGAAGDDSITIDSSVNIVALIYGGDGNNYISNRTSAKATIVTIGNGVNTVTGNGINTSFWVNTGDVVNASSTETTLNGVNRVSNFYQPWSSSTASADYVTRDLYGQNFRDPSDTGAIRRLTANSFWGLGASMNDINQGSVGDCYFLAPLASLAYSEPLRLMNSAVDLGDGTYAFRFVRGGVTSYVRVDGDLPAGGWNGGVAYNHAGGSGNIWGVIYEKAYAFFRTGANTYDSLGWGNPGAAMNDLGFQSSSVSAAGGETMVFNLITAQIAAGKAIATGTYSSITGGAPVVGSHAYSILGAYRDANNQVWIQLRNPWGTDGAGNDGSNDGLVAVTYAQFQANFSVISYSKV